MDFVKVMLKIIIAVIVGIAIFAFLLPKNSNTDVILSEGNGYAMAMKEKDMVDFSILCLGGKVYLKGTHSSGENTTPIEHDETTGNNILCKSDHPYIMTISIPKY